MREKNKMPTGVLCAIGCETLFGFGYVVTKSATNDAGAFELLGWRFLIAFAVMSLLVALGVLKINLRHKNISQLIIIAILSPVLCFIGDVFGISMTSASESGVFLACIPVASLVASSLLLKKKPTKWQTTGIAITLIGVIITVLAVGANTSLCIPGYLFLTLEVVTYALYCVYVEKAEGFTEVEMTFVMIAFGAAVFVTIAVAQALFNGNLMHLAALPFKNPKFLICVLYQGIGCSILSFFLSAAAIVRIGVNRTASFIGVSTVVSIFAGMLVLKETLSLFQFIGAAVIIAGIYIANVQKNKENAL